MCTLLSLYRVHIRKACKCVARPSISTVPDPHYLVWYQYTYVVNILTLASGAQGAASGQHPNRSWLDTFDSTSEFQPRLTQRNMLVGIVEHRPLKCIILSGDWWAMQERPKQASMCCFSHSWSHSHSLTPRQFQKKKNKKCTPVGVFGTPRIDHGVPSLLPIMMLGSKQSYTSTR